MAQTIVGLYDTFDQARDTVEDLVNSGFDRDSISLVAHDADQQYAKEYGARSPDDDMTEEGIVGGGVAGAVIGGIAGLALAPLCYANDGAQVRHHRLEATRIKPTPALLVDRLPRRQIVGQHPPGRSRAHQPTQGVEDLTQIVLALRRLRVHQGQVGRSEAPFFIADVCRVRLAGHLQTLSLAPRSRSKVHNTL